MSDISGGLATAAAVPDAKLVIFDGMGHHLPPELWAELAGHIARTGAAGRGEPLI